MFTQTLIPAKRDVASFVSSMPVGISLVEVRFSSQSRFATPKPGEEGKTTQQQSTRITGNLFKTQTIQELETVSMRPQYTSPCRSHFPRHPVFYLHEGERSLLSSAKSIYKDAVQMSGRHLFHGLSIATANKMVPGAGQIAPVLALLFDFFFFSQSLGAPLLDSIANPYLKTFRSILSGKGLIEGTLGAVAGAVGVEETFDYVVIGGGMKGNAICVRLAEAGFSVAILEAGAYCVIR
ncbi:hypothetical protein MPH_12460 [Macrophomina phaseolina MS6]|uniref:Uncharacterized protein n=1 Tax=Macrophomina phaseolina (strain MS6) TaxID=1126212 RepID=K2RCJ1_MACPH|nr:hypothetical protein MPH_12460 [Macrophomina phaseolina MS6]